MSEVWQNQFKWQHEIWQLSFPSVINPVAAAELIDPFTHRLVNLMKYEALETEQIHTADKTRS